MKKHVTTLLVLVGLLCLTGCVEPNHLTNTRPDKGGEIAGFLHGLWHGYMIVVNFVLSLFSSGKNGIYAIHNDGHWYNLGYILGVFAFVQSGYGIQTTITYKKTESSE